MQAHADMCLFVAAVQYTMIQNEHSTFSRDDT